MALITTLDQAVTDTNLLPLGAIRLLSETVTDPTDANRVCGIAGPFTAEINGDGYFTDQTLTENLGKTITFTGAAVHYFWTSNGSYEIFVKPKYGLLQLILSANGVYADIDTLAYMTDCETMMFASELTKGDISNIKECPALTSLRRTTTTLALDGIEGDVDELLDNVPSLRTLDMSRTRCKATLKKIAESSLTTLSLFMTEAVSGDLSEFADYTQFESFSIGALRVGVNTKITGSITALGKNINATRLGVAYTSVTGTCDDLAAALAANGKTSGTVSITDGSGTTKSFTFPLS